MQVNVIVLQKEKVKVVQIYNLFKCICTQNCSYFVLVNYFS